VSCSAIAVNVGDFVGMRFSERSVNRGMGIKMWLVHIVAAKFRRHEFRAYPHNERLSLPPRVAQCACWVWMHI
jgi:hypothetical protein